VKYYSFKAIQLTLVIILLLTLTMCGSSNRLREYEFRGQTAAAMMAVPPLPEVFTDSFIGIDRGDPIGSVLRIGTTIAKSVEVHNTQARLDSAMEQVDVPDRITNRILRRCSRYLDYRPVLDTEDADFLFVIDIQKYGVDAKSWNASVYFRIDVKVQLIDNRRSVEVWKKRVKEKQPVSREMFGLGDATGDIITAVALSRLTVDDMVTGFEHLADYTADRVIERLHDDFVEARLKH